MKENCVVNVSLSLTHVSPGIIPIKFKWKVYYIIFFCPGIVPYKVQKGKTKYSAICYYSIYHTSENNDHKS